MVCVISVTSGESFPVSWCGNDELRAVGRSYLSTRFEGSPRTSASGYAGNMEEVLQRVMNVWTFALNGCQRKLFIYVKPHGGVEDLWRRALIRIPSHGLERKGAINLALSELCQTKKASPVLGPQGPESRVVRGPSWLQWTQSIGTGGDVFLLLEVNCIQGTGFWISVVDLYKHQFIPY